MATTTSFEKQASYFLEKTNTEFSCEFIKYGKHFVDDEDERDIYKVTLKREGRIYSFLFGQSIANSGYFFGDQQHFFDSDKCKYGETSKKKLVYGFYRTKKVKNLDLYVHMDMDTDQQIIKKTPTAYDVLTCLTKYDPYSFNDFCLEYGYSNDSIKAKKTYNEVKDEYVNLCLLFNEKEMKLLQEIE